MLSFIELACLEGILNWRNKNTYEEAKYTISGAILAYFEVICFIGKHFKSTLKNAIQANGSSRIYTLSQAASPKFLWIFLFGKLGRRPLWQSVDTVY